MEVHKHPHHVTHGKKWFEYILEFLMIFLAVTLGFFAESFREYKIERSHEKKYVKSLAEDLQIDINVTLARFKTIEDRVRKIDTLQKLLIEYKNGQPANDIYTISMKLQRISFIGLNDRTLAQLRNAGGMRTIENKKLADSIFYYYKNIGDFMDNARQLLFAYFRELDPIYQEIFYGKVFRNTIDSTGTIVNLREKLTLRSTDDKAINGFLIILTRIRSLLSVINGVNNQVVERATHMREMIAREY